MSDYGTEYTDKMVNKVNREINKVYSDALKDIQNKMADFESRFRVKDAKYQKMLENGEIDQDQYDSWLKGQVFQSKMWKSKEDQIVKVMVDANKTATSIVNDKKFNVFAENANWTAYSLENGNNINFGFDLYDSTTIANLIKNNPQTLPKWKINEPKDYVWNKKKVNRSITQGIIQGESLDKIAKRLTEELATTNKNHMRTFARTAMTGAQNAGRDQRLIEAEQKDINVVKQWMATLDGRTRDSHARIDGETIKVKSKGSAKFSNGCRYPGDPEGPPHEVYNCRCTLVGDVVDYPDYFSRRDNESGQVINKLGADTVANVTYSDWKITKGVINKAHNAEVLEKISETLLEAASLGKGTVNYAVGNGKTSFDFKFKGFDSLFRKISTKSVSKGLTKEQYAKKITDALRFTNLSPTETLTQDYFKMVNHLESKGFKMVEVTNTFVNYTSYRGINTLVRSPDGYIFELQFHTTESMSIKEINHKLYEEERKLDKIKDASRIRDLISTQNSNAESIPTPEDVEMILNIG